MSARRPIAVAVTAAVLAVVLWWLARDLVVVDPPTAGTPHDVGPVARTVTDPRLLLAAAVAAGVALVAATVSALRFVGRRDG